MPLAYLLYTGIFLDVDEDYLLLMRFIPINLKTYIIYI